MNTILKSFFLTFFPLDLFTWSVVFLEKTTHLDVQRADDLSEQLKKEEKNLHRQQVEKENYLSDLQCSYCDANQDSITFRSPVQHMSWLK